MYLIKSVVQILLVKLWGWICKRFWDIF